MLPEVSTESVPLGRLVACELHAACEQLHQLPIHDGLRCVWHSHETVESLDRILLGRPWPLTYGQVAALQAPVALQILLLLLLLRPLPRSDLRLGWRLLPPFIVPALGWLAGEGPTDEWVGIAERTEVRLVAALKSIRVELHPEGAEEPSGVRPVGCAVQGVRLLGQQLAHRLEEVGTEHGLAFDGAGLAAAVVPLPRQAPSASQLQPLLELTIGDAVSFACEASSELLL
mmetsp:Transcript_49449/g.159202  ORF Transcript_49449/g.159202 Transcript_49449/m.159202 type:complete len:230 (+) Transcript_49449:741-1430(+)